MADKPSKGLADVVAASTALSDIDGSRCDRAAARCRFFRPNELRGPPVLNAPILEASAD